MTVKIPTEVPDILYPAIEASTKELEANALQTTDNWSTLSTDRDMQDNFLDHFAKTFNLSLSLRMTGAKSHQLMRWRSTEIGFVQRYNDIHQEWKARLITSAMSRAVGYTTACDPSQPTTSGLMEDALGNPIFQGADSRLTLRMLEAHFPETYSPTLSLLSTDPAARVINDDASAAEAADSYALIMTGS
jgi:hypothetical protein